jgi:hypothetical protein
MAPCEVKLILTDAMIEQFGRDLILKKITGNFHPQVDMMDHICLLISREIAQQLRKLMH